MPIKYAEITIIRNLEEEGIFDYLNRLLLGNENLVNDNDSIIILFDDETIYDIKNDNNDKNDKFKMGPIKFNTHLPRKYHTKNM